MRSDLLSQERPGVGTAPGPKKGKQMTTKYENKSLELRKHLKNAIEYMKHDRTNFSLPKTISFLEGYVDGLESWELENYDLWLEDQKQNAEVS